MKKKIMIGTVIAVILLAAAAAALTKTGLAGRLAGGLTGGAAGSAQGAMGASGMPGGQQAAGGGGAAGGAQGRGQGAGASANYAVVKTEYPHTGDVSVTSSLTGTVESSDVVRLYAKAAGDVTAVEVSAGDNVEAGQVLIRINTDQIASARNQLDSAEVSVNQAQSNLNRMQILYNGGDITQQEYEQYNNQLRSAQLQYESAKINYERQLGYSEITAPIAGRIETIGVDVYDHVNANAEICVIAGEGEKRVTVYVSERMMQHLRTGDPLTVVKNGREYSGRITEINTMVDSATGLFKVRAELENTEEIATGSSVKVILTTDRSEHVMLVPVDAIYYSGGKAYLYVVEDGACYMRFVEVGLYDDTVAEILSGLEETDLVVSTWSSNLYEGARIRLYDDVAGEGAQGQMPQQPGR